MEKKIFFAGVCLLVLLSSFSLLSCGGDDDEGEYVSGTDGVVTTNAPGEVTYSSATITGTINQEFLTNASVDYFGVSYGKDSEADDYSRTTNTITGTTFTITLSGLSSETTYYYKVFIKDNGGNYIYGSTRKFTTGKKDVSAGSSVDLGLPSGTKWADRNVGASSPEDYGDYFAWGETNPKDSYTEDNSATYGLGYSTLKTNGIIDSNGNLTAAYDAATANWGEGWKMPTLAQIQELVNKCEWTWSSKNGVNGYFVTGSNGNSIFLPAAGRRYGTSLYDAGSYGYYWSSTAGESDSYNAFNLYFSSGYYGWSSYGCRYDGQSVRPVSE